MLKITKFGSITEQEDGELLFEDFIIEAPGSNEGMQVITLTVIIDRLQKELDIWNKANGKHRVPPLTSSYKHLGKVGRYEWH